MEDPVVSLLIKSIDSLKFDINTNFERLSGEIRAMHSEVDIMRERQTRFESCYVDVDKQLNQAFARIRELESTVSGIPVVKKVGLWALPIIVLGLCTWVGKEVLPMVWAASVNKVVVQPKIDSTKR